MAIGPMMVPVGDILNHIAKNNAHLRFKENELEIVSTKQIKKVLLVLLNVIYCKNDLD